MVAANRWLRSDIKLVSTFIKPILAAPITIAIQRHLQIEHVHDKKKTNTQRTKNLLSSPIIFFNVESR